MQKKNPIRALAKSILKSLDKRIEQLNDGRMLLFDVRKAILTNEIEQALRKNLVKTVGDLLDL